MKPFNIENSTKINSGFKVPENYFDQFEAKIMSQIEKNEVKVISIFQKRKFWLTGVAAIFVLGLFATIYISNKEINVSKNDDLLAFENTISNEDIVEHLTDADITELEKSLVLYDLETQNYAKEYLD